jgi:hypothetical protein
MKEEGEPLKNNNNKKKTLEISEFSRTKKKSNLVLNIQFYKSNATELPYC